MDEVMSSRRFWCHRCSRIVNSVADADVKCPQCDGGFVEEMSPGEQTDQAPAFDVPFSPWTPFFLGMLASGGGASIRLRRPHSERAEGENQRSDDGRRDSEADQRRQRSSAAILDLLRALGQSDSGSGDGGREHVVIINPLDHAIVLRTSMEADWSPLQGSSGGGVAFGDYFLGPNLELLLQQLAENDPSRYGTPPAQKEAVEALPTVKVEGSDGAICSVCLEDFEPGAEAREMPCSHRFHGECILPWLGLHSSCPVCRYQLPADESKIPNVGNNGGGNRAEGDGGSGDGGNRAGWRRFWISWPLGSLFTPSRAATAAAESAGDGNSAATPSPEASEN